MRRHKFRRAISYIVILAVLQVGIITALFLTRDNSTGDLEKQQYDSFLQGKEPPMSVNNQSRTERAGKKAIDTSKVNVGTDIVNAFKKADNKNADKLMQKYKTLLAEFNIPENFRSVLEGLIKKGDKPRDIFIAYEFLFENYGRIEDIRTLLDKRKAGAGWGEIFKEYNSTNKEFVPSKFDSVYLDNLMKTPGITADDIMIADRISKKGLKRFEELIDLRKQGKSWKEINTTLGVVNVDDKLPYIAISGQEVQECVKKTGLKEDQVLESLIIAQKTGKTDDEIIEKVKRGKTKEDISAELYAEKYE